MTPIEKLANQVGFHTSYINSFGQQVYATDESRLALLKAMGFSVDNEQQIDQCIDELANKPWLQLLPTTHIIKSEETRYLVPVTVNSEHQQQSLKWRITTEAGELISGEVALNSLELIAEKAVHQRQYARYNLPLPKIEEGYHDLNIELGESTNTEHAHCFLINAPKTCYAPKDAASYKMWGLAAQLYSLKSEHSWGIGDFSDLKQLVKDSAANGASTIGLNPLHPLFPGNPAHRSPYSPTSRTFLNTIYIDVSQVANFSECKAAVKLVNSKNFKEQIALLNNSDHIDYAYVANLKTQALELLYQHFEKEHLTKNSPLSQKYLDFCNEFGDDLNVLATFDALYEYFRKLDFNAFGWTTWPQEYQDPNSQAVKNFQQQNQSRIGYFKFIQWVADCQIGDVASLAKRDGMALGLYLDLAVGCDGGGADVWANRSVYVAGGSVGAPPDATNCIGQDWGLTPINPIVLKEQGFHILVTALRSNMRHAGALRIDHVLGYMRQYWVAPGKRADEGIYITFPFEDMLRIIALESQRARCIVIGEDLGTVPEGFGEIMAAAGLLSYRVLFFERWEDGLFQRPEHYPEQSMVTVSTHDLPTLAGWWTGTDLGWRQQLNLYPNEQMGVDERNNRVADRNNLIAAMIDMQVLDPNDKPPTSPAAMNSALAEAVQRYLSRAPSAIQLIPLEDALSMKQQVNIPGTIDEHPNWLQRLPLDINQIWQQTDLQNLVKVMQQERPVIRSS